MADPAPSGLLLVDKPRGITSHDAVSRVRRALGIRKVGHAGTLDPMATGLLVMGVGRGTRLLRFLGDQPKDYEGVGVLGLTTTTLDAEGDPVETRSFERITLPDVQRATAAAPPAGPTGGLRGPAGLDGPYRAQAPDGSLVGIYRDDGSRAVPEVILA